jgi:SPP1 family predicted phage head-tail adaptor
MIGKLRHQVQLQKRSRVADGAGGFTHTWATVLTTKAQMKPANAGTERQIAGRVSSPVTHVCTVRKNIVAALGEDVTSSWRIVFDSKNYNVRGVQDLDEAERWLAIYTEQDVPT